MIDGEPRPPEPEAENASPESPKSLAHYAGRFLPKIAVAGAILAIASPAKSELNSASQTFSDAATTLAKSMFGQNQAVNLHSATPRQAFEYTEALFGRANGLYSSVPEGPPAQIWANYTMLSALRTLSLVPGRHQLEYNVKFNRALHTLNGFWGKGGPNQTAAYFPAANDTYHGKHARFGDDNGWMGGLVINRSLARAESIFNFGVSLWDQQAGGTYWQEQLPGNKNHDRAVVSNATYAKLGALLYAKTGETRYFVWSDDILSWLKNNLCDESVGLYNDHINEVGKVDHRKRTYVQGIVAGAIATISPFNPYKYPMQDAVNLIDRTINYAALHDSYGETAYDAIFFSNALLVASKYNKPAFTDRVQRALHQAIKRMPSQPDHLRYAAGATELLALNALPAKDYGKLQ